MPTCADMLCAAVNAYLALQGGREVVEVQFGEERVKYQPKSMPHLLDHIRRLNIACPNEAASALLGLGGGGPLSVSFGCGSRRRGCGC
jgi:hypothetical protein